MNQRLLVTGAGGFIGRALLAVLEHSNRFEIHAVSSRTAPIDSKPATTWHTVDLLDAPSVERLFASLRPEFLMQLAWCADHATYWRDHANFEWLAANLRMARAFVKNGGTRCLFTGSSAEYDWSGQGPLHESPASFKPQLLYGSCKLACNTALQAFFNQEGISWVWARLFCPFGPMEDRRRLIPKSCLRLLAGEQINFDSGQTMRDFLHIDDIASAFVATLDSPMQGAVNVASGNAVSIRDIVSGVARHLDAVDRVSFAPPSSNGTVSDVIVADVAMLREHVGWKPAISLDERLRQTCEWWKHAMPKLP